MLKKILEIVFKNFWYKLGSVCLAVFIWGVVQGEEIIEYSARIKVDISVANGYAIKGSPIRYIDANLKGPRVLLGELVNEVIEAKVYISAGETGNLEIPFKKKFIKDWDNRIKLTVRDNYINVFVDEEITKEVTIREVLQGAPAEGYFIERVIITPAKVRVTGIKADVSKLEEIATEPIDINRINQSAGFEANLVTTDLGISSLDIESVKVRVQLADSRINKNFDLIPVEIVGAEYIASVRPKSVSIVIQGTPGVLSFVKKEDLRAFVELTNIKPGRYDREIQVKIPPNTVLIETSPAIGSIEVYNQKREN